MQPNDIDTKLAALAAKLDATVQAIKDKAPNATIVMLPYLRVLPAIAKPLGLSTSKLYSPGPT